LAVGEDCTADTDGDGLDDCTEVQTTGTDPAVGDSDGDGYLDGEEIDCGTDPLAEAQKCYACGWQHADPGDLTSTGAAIGDTIENLDLDDQCEERASLWDFAEEYHILFITAAW